MSRFDYRDPGTDPAYADGLQPEEPDFECSWCGNITDDDRCWPFCDGHCAALASGDSEEDEAPDDEPDPRERGDDDGREYGDPRDAREERDRE